MKMVEKVVIPASQGRTVYVEAGDQIRIVAVEGAQAADVAVLNAHDYRESLSVWLSRHMSKSFTRAETFYSKLPVGQVMLEVESAPPRAFWLSPGRCNRLKYEQLGKPDHANCQDILADCLEPYGISSFEVPEVLNIFMAATFTEDGSYTFEPSPVAPGDHVALRAKMDLLVAVSACPDDSAYNLGRPKPLEVEVWR